MARNGSGTFSLVTNSWNPAIDTVPATATDWQTLVNDIASALTQSVSKDGQTPMTGNLAMGGNKLTGLSAGTSTGDSLRFEQLFSQGQPADLASAATTDIGAQNTTLLNITGTTSITSFGANYNGPRFLRFDGILTLTHSATLVLPGAANITTAAGDSAIFVPVGSPAAGWRCVIFSRAAGLYATAGPLASSGITGAAASGANSDITSLTACTTITGLTTPIAETRQIQPISASVSGNALTISASALSLEFRSATLTSGAVSFVEGTPSNLVNSSGSTLGTVSAQQSRIVVLALNNAGTIELAAVNISGGNDLTETGVISTTAEGGAGAADSATVIYSTTARTNVAYRVLGYIESTQATAGTWATAPSTIQGYGGQALAAMSSVGYSQTWQSFAVGVRPLGTTFYNTTGRPIQVGFTCGNSGATSFATVNGVTVGRASSSTSTEGAISFIVPPGGSYSIANGTFVSWSELR